MVAHHDPFAGSVAVKVCVPAAAFGTKTVQVPT
jgi:hypothetical protein